MVLSKLQTEGDIGENFHWDFEHNELNFSMELHKKNWKNSLKRGCKYKNKIIVNVSTKHIYVSWLYLPKRILKILCGVQWRENRNICAIKIWNCTQLKLLLGDTPELIEFLPLKYFNDSKNCPPSVFNGDFYQIMISQFNFKIYCINVDRWLAPSISNW